MSPYITAVVRRHTWKRALSWAGQVRVACSSVPVMTRKVLTENGVNPNLQAMEYAVRGELVRRADVLAERLERGGGVGEDVPFEKVVYCNIGNPQSVGQRPVTFLRQVLAGVTCPSLVEGGKEGEMVFEADVVGRVKEMLSVCNGVGAYTDSRGIPYVRRRIAKALERRDGVGSDPDCIFLTNGASDSVKVMLNMLIRECTDGVMIPIPQYPLYSATLTALNGVQVGYYLDENNGWALNLDELETRLEEARRVGVNVRALVVINPGNPTGQVLDRHNLEQVVRFCEREGLMILADEVYQRNVYTEKKPFVSFKKVVREMGSPVELVSFHSVSKGFLGECGLRGGFMEVINMEKYVQELIYKVLSVSLCSNVVGQIAVDLMMTPPEQGEPSYELYEEETGRIFNSLKRKASILADGLNSFEGVSCNASEGAMYLFPRVTMPRLAVIEAEKRGMMSADVLYCIEMLEQTGICVVPGSGFGQMEGTYHFRTTFLPPEEDIPGVLERMRKFHENFLEKYRMGK